MKFVKKCPLLFAVLLSSLCLTAVVRGNQKDTYQEYLETAGVKPGISAFFLGMKDGIWFAGEEMLEAMAPVTEQDIVEEESTDPEILKETSLEETAAGEEEHTEASFEETEEDALEETEALPEPVLKLEFVSVEEEYFDDALFIGDSRTQGMLEYGGLEERATFFCRTSLTVHDLFEKNKAFILIDDEKVTLRDALSQKQYGKIYLMLGINELGTGTPDTFLASYAAAVEEIRQMQPDAIIFIQGIMRVAGKKNASDPIFNNENINIRNERLMTLADNQKIFYVEVNEAVCDEEGNLYDDWTFDQIHLKAKYYEIWKNYLLMHGIVL